MLLGVLRQLITEALFLSELVGCCHKDGSVYELLCRDWLLQWCDSCKAKNEIIMRVFQFLMGLSPQFSAVRGQILLMPVLPTLNEAYTLLLQEEEQRSCVVLPIEPSLSDSTALLVKKFGTTKGKAKLFCDYYKDTGHSRDKCFILNGYPAWFKGPQFQAPSNTDNTFHKGQVQSSPGYFKGKYAAQASHVTNSTPAPDKILKLIRFQFSIYPGSVKDNLQISSYD